MKIRRIVQEGSKPPAGYGVAFTIAGASVCYPVTLHYFMRRLYGWMIELSEPTQNEQERILSSRIEQAYNDGIGEGERRYRASLQNIRNEEWRKGVEFGFERGVNTTRNDLDKIIAEKLKSVMDGEVLAGRWWTMPPEESQ